jgi:hypothetical protein
MAQNNRQLGWRRSAFNFIQFGMAYATGGYLYQNFIVPRNRGGDINRFQWIPIVGDRAKLSQHHGFHAGTISSEKHFYNL